MFGKVKYHMTLKHIMTLYNCISIFYIIRYEITFNTAIACCWYQKMKA